MRLLAVLLLVANALFFVWRFNAQLEDDLAARRRLRNLHRHELRWRFARWRQLRQFSHQT